MCRKEEESDGDSEISPNENLILLDNDRVADELLVQKEPGSDLQSWQHYCVMSKTAADVNTNDLF